jgi:hypothetical protein
MGFEQLIIIRSYDRQSDRAQVEDLERRCEVGPAERVFLFTDTMGDPICRIRNSPMYKMLVQLFILFHLLLLIFFAPLLMSNRKQLILMVLGGGVGQGTCWCYSRLY